MEQKLPKEIDFRLEAQNALKCSKNFEDNPQVIVPEIFIAKPRLLVMSFERGISVAKVKEMFEQGLDLKDVSHLISETFVKMTQVNNHSYNTVSDSFF